MNSSDINHGSFIIIYHFGNGRCAFRDLPGGKGGGAGGRTSSGSVAKQSSSSGKFRYPCAPTKENDARTAQSMAMSRVRPLPQPRSTPPTLTEKQNGFSGVIPLFHFTYDASIMRCDFVYFTKASIATVILSARYFFTKKLSPVCGLAFLAGFSPPAWGLF